MPARGNDDDRSRAGRTISPCILLLAAIVCFAALWPVGAFAGPDRVQEALRIAQQHWGPLCCAGGVDVVRGDLPPGVLAHASYSYPPGGADDPARYYDRRIIVRRGHIAWPRFCTAVVHEAGHLDDYHAPLGHEYTRPDGTKDPQHSNDPFDVMFPVLEHTFPGCRGPEPGTHRAPHTIARRDAHSVTVLLLPGGGWQHADPATMNPWVQDFQQHGIRARAISYPLRDVVGAIEYVHQVAGREPGPVVAYGISAGGTIAAALAAQGDVAGAVDIAGPTDFTRWWTPAGLVIMRQIGMNTYAERRGASPYWMLTGRQAPQLVQCGLADPLVTFEQCVRYVHAARLAQPDTRLDAMAAAHNQWSIDRDRAREWIAARWPSP